MTIKFAYLYFLSILKFLVTLFADGNYSTFLYADSIKSSEAHYATALSITNVKTYYSETSEIFPNCGFKWGRVHTCQEIKKIFVQKVVNFKN